MQTITFHTPHCEFTRRFTQADQDSIDCWTASVGNPFDVVAMMVASGGATVAEMPDDTPVFDRHVDPTAGMTSAERATWMCSGVEVFAEPVEHHWTAAEIAAAEEA